MAAPTTVPDGTAAWAVFSNAYPEAIGASLTSDITLNRLVYLDTDGTVNFLTVSGRRITFDGTSPALINSNTADSLIVSSTVRVDNVTLTLGGRANIWNSLTGPIEGNGTLFIDSGRWNPRGVNSNFTGTIISSNRVSGGTEIGLESWSAPSFAHYWTLGDTNADTRIYDRGYVSLMPYSAGLSNADEISRLSRIVYSGEATYGGFTHLTSHRSFDPGFDGTFSGKPDLGTFDVSGTTFQIDYSATDIKLTVVPEPQTLGLLGLAALGGLLRRRIRR